MPSIPPAGLTGLVSTERIVGLCWQASQLA